MKPILFTLIVLTFFLSENIIAQKTLLRQKIAQIAQTSKGKVGVAVINFEKKDTITYNGYSRLPMQSVYKFPLGMTILSQIDKGNFSFNQKIHITKTDLLTVTYSPLKDKYPEGNTDITLKELLEYTVSKSDNNGCDILFRLIGGPLKVNDYIHSIGIQGISIVATEQEMHKDWNVQFTNWCEPMAMARLLELIYQGNKLSQQSNDFLKKQMTETTIGPNRIKGLLPEGTIVTHKTGSSNTNDKGITAATNDVGIVTLPNGQHFAIVIFVVNSPEKIEIREGVIAQITKAVWDYYTQKN